VPPLYQDPLSAVPGAAWSLGDVLRALVEVACQAWAVALVALAVYSFLERDVKGVLKAVAPLLLALAAAGALALAARAVGGLPRPLAGAGQVVPLLRRAFPSEQSAAVAVFATYTALAYGRRAVPAVLAAVVVGLGHALGGTHWALELAAGGIAGVSIGAAAYGAALRVFPRGHLADLRAARGGGARAASP
jgi:membrane-associated phospholipid phosphatase